MPWDDERNGGGDHGVRRRGRRRTATARRRAAPGRRQPPAGASCSSAAGSRRWRPAPSRRGRRRSITERTSMSGGGRCGSGSSTAAGGRAVADGPTAASHDRGGRASAKRSTGRPDRGRSGRSADRDSTSSQSAGGVQQDRSVEVAARSTEIGHRDVVGIERPPAAGEREGGIERGVMEQVAAQQRVADGDVALPAGGQVLVDGHDTTVTTGVAGRSHADRTASQADAARHSTPARGPS